ncbi:MAG: Na+/H+ antiporter NhaA [Pseudomonadota bacterium]
MNKASITLSNTFNRFFDSEKSSGILLIFFTLVSILLANSSIGHEYLSLWQIHVAGLSLEHWINDGLMAIFFLLIGLELEREIYVGELSNFKNALLPIFAAIGGMLVPALIHYSFNQSTLTQNGIGIPMATDIAFALGVLAILGNRIPASLKVFVVAFAVIDDLGAIVLIAVFYTAKFSINYLLAALLVWAVLIVLNRLFRVMSLLPSILGGVIMWFFMLKSGIHATVAGIMLAFAIPFSVKDDDQKSPSHQLEHFLHKPVAFVILPIFALANTGITIEAGWMNDLMSTNSLGIMLGLIIGKPLGVGLFCGFAVIAGICRLPTDLNWLHIVGAGILGGIGFTMSIFITNLAFPASVETVNAAKMAILLASLSAGVFGFIWFKLFTKTAASD